MLEQFNGIKQLFRKVYPRRCSVLGIDINPTAVYMVELGYDQKSLSLISYASTSFDHLQKEESSATTQSLFKEFIAQEKKRRKSAITALSDQQVMNKSISLQCGLSVEELEASIIVEMQRNAPLKWSDISWDYETLSINEVNSEQNLFFVAAKTEHIHSRMELLSFAGLKPKVIELVSHAVERAAQYVFPRIAGNLNNKTVALIQMGDSTLTLFIVQQSKMCAIRETPITLEKFDKNSQSFESNLIKHIKELIEYTQSTNPLSIQHILLMGEKAVGATNLAQKIEMDLRITTVLANPLVAFFNPGQNQPEDLLLLAPALWIAVGLALRILDGNH